MAAQPLGGRFQIALKRRRFLMTRLTLALSLSLAASTITVAALEEMVGSVPVPRVGAVGAFPANLADRKVLEFCVYDTDPSGVHHLVSGFVPGPLR